MDNGENFYIFGINPILEKLKAAPGDVAEVMIAKSHERGALRGIELEARGRGLPVRYVESRVLDRLAGGHKHQGVMARVRPFAYASFTELVEGLSAAAGTEWILFLDGVTNPGNFGALLRCAEAVGIRHIVIPRDRSVGVTPTVIKASAGAAHHLRICRVTNLRRAIQAVKDKGFWAVGLDAESPERIYDREYPEKLAVVLGSEGAGIRPLIRQECDFLVSIPMKGRIESLNVAVAGGVFLYELLRRAAGA